MTFAADNLGINYAIKAFSKNTADYIKLKKEFEFIKQQSKEQQHEKNR